MSANDDSGEKTEQPTAKKLRDARRDGEVPKSHDLSHTATTLIWALLLLGLGGFFADRLSALIELAWTEVDIAAPDALRTVGFAALQTLLLLTVLPLGIVALGGVLVELMQTGVVFAPKRIAPQLSRLSPATGFKRVFSLDNVFEMAKALFKTALLSGLIVVLIKQHLADILRVPDGGIAAYAGLDRRLILQLIGWVVALFAFVSIGDLLFQRFSHRKRLRMTKDEVRRERKEEDGDPQLRGQRRRLHRQWSTQDARQAAREATALVVNPTHIAVALQYDPATTAVPLITAKGEGNLARLMRLEAEAAGVPVIRNVPLARGLNYRGEEDDYVPEEFFDAVAEVIAWAQQMRAAPSGTP
jgi:type III secretion protein U